MADNNEIKEEDLRVANKLLEEVQTDDNDRVDLEHLSSLIEEAANNYANIRTAGMIAAHEAGSNQFSNAEILHKQQEHAHEYSNRITGAVEMLLYNKAAIHDVGNGLGRTITNSLGITEPFEPTHGITCISKDECYVDRDL